MDHEYYYLILDTRYLKTAGIQRSLRFSRIFTSCIEVIKYLSSVPDPELYEVIPIGKEEMNSFIRRE